MNFQHTIQAPDPPFLKDLRFNFSYEMDIESTVLLLKKAARCQPFLAVVRCLFHNHLRLKRSSLLNVYLNCKFEISLLSSYLFFSLFILKFQLVFVIKWYQNIISVMEKARWSTRIMHQAGSSYCCLHLLAYILSWIRLFSH